MIDSSHMEAVRYLSSRDLETGSAGTGANRIGFFFVFWEVWKLWTSVSLNAFIVVTMGSASRSAASVLDTCVSIGYVARVATKQKSVKM